MSANYWATKFSNSNKCARRLTKLLAMAQKNLGIDVIIDHVIGILNGFVDTVNRGKPSVTLNTHLKKDYPTNPAAFTCLQVSLAVKQVALKHFQLSPDLLSHIENLIGQRYGRPTRAIQKQLGTNCSRTNHDIRFCCKQLELDPRLEDLSLADQDIVAICYLDDLTRGTYITV